MGPQLRRSSIRKPQPDPKIDQPISMKLNSTSEFRLSEPYPENVRGVLERSAPRPGAFQIAQHREIATILAPQFPDLCFAAEIFVVPAGRRRYKSRSILRGRTIIGPAAPLWIARKGRGGKPYREMVISAVLPI